MQNLIAMGLLNVQIIIHLYNTPKFYFQSLNCNFMNSPMCKSNFRDCADTVKDVLSIMKVLFLCFETKLVSSF